MTRPIALALIAALAGSAALACGLPPGEVAASPCALVRLMEGHVCIDDPSVAEGYRIRARGVVSEPAVGAGPEGG